MSRAIPVISVEYQSDNSAPRGFSWVLIASSHGHTAIVGPRILRGNGVLDISVRHATRESAEIAADKLRTYLAAQGKPGKHRGEVVAVNRKHAWWED